MFTSRASYTDIRHVMRQLSSGIRIIAVEILGKQSSVQACHYCKQFARCSEHIVLHSHAWLLCILHILCGGMLSKLFLLGQWRIPPPPNHLRDPNRCGVTQNSTYSARDWPHLHTIRVSTVSVNLMWAGRVHNTNGKNSRNRTPSLWRNLGGLGTYHIAGAIWRVSDLLFAHTLIMCYLHRLIGPDT